MKILALLLSMLLVSCGGGNPIVSSVQATAIDQSSAYYPMQDGTGIVYDVVEVTSRWHADTQDLVIERRGPVLNQQTLQYSRHDCAALGAMMVSTYRLGANPPRLVDLTQSLQDTFFSIGGIRYIGEGINNLLNMVTPGEAKITLYPVAGEVIPGASVVTQSCTDSSVLSAHYAWRYRTIEHLDNWRGHKDVWRTGLIELDTGAVYNYAFSHDVGMVAFWFGNVRNADGTVGGLEYFSQP